MRSKFSMPSNINPVIAFGVHDSNLRLIERLTQVKITPRENDVCIDGPEEEVSRAYQALQSIFILAQGNSPISHHEIKLILDQGIKTGGHSAKLIKAEGLILSKRGNRLIPRSTNQAQYIQEILNHDMIFGVGPAGTGKTYLAVAAGIHLLFTGRVSRMILTRPVVETGESLGFLPGTLEEKIDPYLRPLFDAISEMLSPEDLKNLMETQAIELAPLAYMRGRTLSNAFIILDEAQNTTAMQMKMFLTRLGENSKMVITGDVTQIDLPRGRESGLKQAVELFTGLEGIRFMEFQQQDIVRHGLVKKILEIYEKREEEVWQKMEVR